jgi:hypothetical protein
MDRMDRRDARADARHVETFGRGVTGRPTATQLIAAAREERQARVAREKAKPVTAGQFAEFMKHYDGLVGDVDALWDERA